jgi:two-component system sensor histidine kinase CpxA
LNRLIGQLLTFARLNATGEQQQEFDPLDIAALLLDLAEDAQFEVQGLGRKVNCNCLCDCIIAGNRELLRSAIENVVRNAIRYTVPGTTVEIVLERAADCGHALITVRDHGPGVLEAALPRIFEPFYRVDIASSATDEQSTGLGLAIAHRAITLHNGTIKAANNPGGGLAVTIRLPLAHTAGGGDRPSLP